MTKRQRLTELMTIELVRTGALADERDAVRALYAAGFKYGEIVVCIDARQAAEQEIVAREMSRP